ncbi:MAG: ParM/StbA family protein [Halanaerobacter sp.]
MKEDEVQIREYILEQLNEGEKIASKELLLTAKEDRDKSFIYNEELFYALLDELQTTKELFISEDNIIYKDFVTYIEDITQNFDRKSMKTRMLDYIKENIFGFQTEVYSYQEIEDGSALKIALILERLDKKEYKKILKKLYKSLEYKNRILVITPKKDILNDEYLKRLTEVLKAEDLIDELEGRDVELLEILEEEEELQEELKAALGNYLLLTKTETGLKLEEIEFRLDKFKRAEMNFNNEKLQNYILDHLAGDQIRAEELLEEIKKTKSCHLVVEDDSFYQVVEDLISSNLISSSKEGEQLYLSSAVNLDMENFGLRRKKEIEEKKAEKENIKIKEAKSMKVFDVVGFDNGYDYVKLVLGQGAGKRTYFPSVTYKQENDFSIFNINDLSGSAKFKKNKMNVTVNGKKYYIGDYAVEQDARGGEKNFSYNKFKEDSELAKLLAGISLFTTEDKIVINNLILGLNVEKYQEYKDEIVNTFKNKSFQYKLPSKKTDNVVRIKNVICVPQGMGAYYDQILDINGRPSKNKLANSRFGLIDIGGKTIDAFISKGTEPIIGTDIGTDFGMADAFKEISNNLEVDVPYNLIARNYIQGQNKVFWRGEDREFDEFTGEEFNNFAHKVHELIIDEWEQQLARIRTILLCGGGAKILRDYLPDIFEVDIKVLDNAQFSNTSGYYKLGVYSVKKKRAQKSSKEEDNEKKAD